MRRNHTKQTLNAFSLFEQQVPSRDRAIEKTADCERDREGTEKETERERGEKSKRWQRAARRGACTVTTTAPK